MKTITVTGKSLIGPRSENQDRELVRLDSGTGLWLAAVADGLGGHVRGAEAAQAAVDQIPDTLPAPEDMSAAFNAAHEAVRLLSGEPPRLRPNWRQVPMSTLCIATGGSDGGEIVVGHSGDTMAYTLRIVDGEIRGGQVGDTHNYPGGAVSHCLGFDGQHAVQRVASSEADAIAVLSDGAWAPLMRTRTAECHFALAYSGAWSAEAVCESLLAAAEQVGLVDNATAAVVCWDQL